MPADLLAETIRDADRVEPADLEAVLAANPRRWSAPTLAAARASKVHVEPRLWPDRLDQIEAALERIYPDEMDADRAYLRPSGIVRAR